MKSIDRLQRPSTLSALSMRLTFFMLLVVTGALTGCARSSFFAVHDSSYGGVQEPAAPLAENARTLAMFTGAGTQLAWRDLLGAASWADIILVGEQHDDAVGHAVELAIAEDVMNRWPRSAISLEMLERDEQPLLDDYFDDLIDAATLAKLTFSEKWAGEGSWMNWYQPLIDAAKNGKGGRAVAANAPRRYVRIARTHGYARLKSMPADRRRLFDFPHAATDGGYRQRFYDLMRDTGAHGEGEENQEPEDPQIQMQRIESSFRSQSLWDATMAASIVRAKRSGAAKVVHFIGQFHSDFNGGTVQQIRRRMPRAKILVVSMQRDEVALLREEDHGRADIIIYTGKRPPKEEPTPTEPELDFGLDDTQPADEISAPAMTVDEPVEAPPHC